MESIPLIASIHRLPILIVSGLVILFCAACDRDEKEPTEAPPPTQIPHQTLTDIDRSDVPDLSVLPDQYRVELTVDEAQLFSACRDIFEDNGEVLTWPLESSDISVTLFGCNPDGHLTFEDGRRAIAYEIPRDDDDRASDLRVILYDKDGKTAWHHLMDRGHQIGNFTANYRGSFLTAIDDRLLCAGTRWLSSTQILCAEQATGNVVYNDEMKFWAGVYPFGFDRALISADIEGITRRYPFTGVEMRHRSFGQRGGRAAFYATDQERIYFVPSRGDTELSAWDVEDLKPVWRADLDDIPGTGFAAASASHRLLFFIIDGLLYGVDTTDGTLRMAFQVTDERPSIVFSDDQLFVLHRRLDEGPLLFAIDPISGAFEWAAEAPAGTLMIDYDDGQIMTRTVRTVRSVNHE